MQIDEAQLFHASWYICIISVLGTFELCGVMFAWVLRRALLEGPEFFLTAKGAADWRLIFFSFSCALLGVHQVYQPFEYVRRIGVVLGLGTCAAVALVTAGIMAALGSIIRQSQPELGSLGDFLTTRFGPLTCKLISLIFTAILCNNLLLEYISLARLVGYVMDFRHVFPIALIIGLSTMIQITYTGFMVSLLTDKLQAMINFVLLTVVALYAATFLHPPTKEFHHSYSVLYSDVNSFSGEMLKKAVHLFVHLLIINIGTATFWQRVFTAVTHTHLVWGASLAGLVSSAIVVFYGVVCTILLYGYNYDPSMWRTSGYQRYPENYIFGMFFGIAGGEAAVKAGKWMAPVLLMQTILMSKSAIDAYQNGLLSIASNLMPTAKNSIKTARIAVAVINLPILLYAIVYLESKAVQDYSNMTAVFSLPVVSAACFMSVFVYILDINGKIVKGDFEVVCSAVFAATCNTIWGQYRAASTGNGIVDGLRHAWWPPINQSPPWETSILTVVYSCIGALLGCWLRRLNARYRWITPRSKLRSKLRKQMSHAYRKLKGRVAPKPPSSQQAPAEAVTVSGASTPSSFLRKVRRVDSDIWSHHWVMSESVQTASTTRRKGVRYSDEVLTPADTTELVSHLQAFKRTDTFNGMLRKLQSLGTSALKGSLDFLSKLPAAMHHHHTDHNHDGSRTRCVGRVEHAQQEVATHQGHSSQLVSTSALQLATLDNPGWRTGPPHEEHALSPSVHAISQLGIATTTAAFESSMDDLTRPLLASHVPGHVTRGSTEPPDSHPLEEDVRKKEGDCEDEMMRGGQLMKVATTTEGNITAQAGQGTGTMSPWQLRPLPQLQPPDTTKIPVCYNADDSNAPLHALTDALPAHAPVRPLVHTEAGGTTHAALSRLLEKVPAVPGLLLPLPPVSGFAAGLRPLPPLQGSLLPKLPPLKALGSNQKPLDD